MNLQKYLSQINDYTYEMDGESLATLLSYQEKEHSTSSRLLHEFQESIVPRYVSSPWDDLVVSHVRCCQLLYEEAYQMAFREQMVSMQVLTKIMQSLKDDNWPLPVLFVTGRDLRLLSIAADKEAAMERSGSGRRPHENLEKAADLLMGIFRVCATDIRASPENSKRKAMMNIINQLFKIYFKINKLHLCKPLIRALDNANITCFPLAEKVTYNYFLGMKSMFDSDFKKAEEMLAFSYRNCYPHSYKNKRLILTFLVPVKMLLGHMPTNKLLADYDLYEFKPIIKAVKEGNLKGLDTALEENADFFWKYGIYLILEKLRIIAYRNVFKKVSLIQKSHQVPIDCFRIALEYLQGEVIALEEVHCILANLIYEGKIKGYISLQHQKLVISKQNPFPALSSVA